MKSDGILGNDWQGFVICVATLPEFAIFEEVNWLCVKTCRFMQRFTCQTFSGIKGMDTIYTWWSAWCWIEAKSNCAHMIHRLKAINPSMPDLYYLSWWRPLLWLGYNSMNVLLFACMESTSKKGLNSSHPELSFLIACAPPLQSRHSSLIL